MAAEFGWPLGRPTRLRTNVSKTFSTALFSTDVWTYPLGSALLPDQEQPCFKTMLLVYAGRDRARPSRLGRSGPDEVLAYGLNVPCQRLPDLRKRPFVQVRMEAAPEGDPAEVHEIHPRRGVSRGVSGHILFIRLLIARKQEFTVMPCFETAGPFTGVQSRQQRCARPRISAPRLNPGIRRLDHQFRCLPDGE